MLLSNDTTYLLIGHFKDEEGGINHLQVSIVELNQSYYIAIQGRREGRLEWFG